MLFTSLQGLVSSLEQGRDLSPWDIEFKNENILRLNNLIDQLAAKQIISDADRQWLSNALSLRWKSIADSAFDYTFNRNLINNAWIALARALDDSFDHKNGLSTHSFKLLFPDLINTECPKSQTSCEQVLCFTDIFITDDKRWYFMPALKNQQSLLLKHTLSSDKTDKNIHFHEGRTWTLKELWRIKQKNDSDASLFSWTHIKENFFPYFAKQGKLPDELIYDLFNIVNDFFAESAQANVASRYAFVLWLFELIKKPYDDVNHLYSQKINVADDSLYLAEVLMKCLYEREVDLTPYYLGLAQWLGSINPSLIIPILELQDHYQNLGIGKKHFTFSVLSQLTNELKNCGNDHVRDELVGLKRYLSRITATEFISEDVVKKIQKLYALRWKVIRDTELDYLRWNAQEINKPWIRLAQYLAGAQHISADYYQLLIPSLKKSINPVSGLRVTELPLTHYILSEGNDELISVNDCLKHLRVHGGATMHNCNFPIPRALTSIESGRLRHTVPEYFSDYNANAKSTRDVPLSPATLQAVVNLVNGSFVPRCLQVKEKYTPDESLSAAVAYIEFSTFYASLGEAERTGLNQHRIQDAGGHVNTFESIWYDVIAREYCIASAGKLFAKLILDYYPDQTFAPHINNVVSIQELRARSNRLLTSDYNYLSDEVALRRVAILFISLLTYPFKIVMGGGKTISAWGFTNVVTATAARIFEVLVKMINDGESSVVRFTYVNLMEKIISPEEKKPWYSCMTRSGDTVQWLKDINNGYYFNKIELTMFAPELILTTLWNEHKSHQHPKISKAFSTFCNESLHTVYQYRKPVLHYIRLNLYLKEYLNTLGSEARNNILELLQTNKSIVSEKEFLACCREISIFQICDRYHLQSPRSSGLFNVTPGNSEFVNMRAVLNNEISLEAADSEELLSHFRKLKSHYPPVGFFLKTMETGLHISTEPSICASELMP